MNKPQALAHGIIALDKLHAAGDLTDEEYLAAVEPMKVAAQRARLVDRLDYLVRVINDEYDVIDRIACYDELLQAREQHGEIAQRRLEQTTPLFEVVGEFTYEG